MRRWLCEFFRAFAPYRQPIDRLGMDAALMIALGITLPGTHGWLTKVIAGLILVVGLIMVYDLQRVAREFEADDRRERQRVRRLPEDEDR